MTKNLVLVIVLSLIVSLTFGVFLVSADETAYKSNLPPAVLVAVKAAFPGAEMKGEGSGALDPRYGVKVFTAMLNYPAKDAAGADVKYFMMVLAAENGVIISSSKRIPDADVAKTAMDAIQKFAAGGVVKYPSRVETFVDYHLAKLPKPYLQYQAIISMPDKSMRNLFVSESGAVNELRTTVAQADLPKPVLDTMNAAAEGGKVLAPCKIETFLDDQFARLDAPRVTCAATLQKEKKYAAIEVLPDGKVVRQDPWQ